MKVYAVARLDITDRAWVADYVRDVTPMVERHGGRYLARTSKIEKLEGDAPTPQVFLIVEWPSREAAETFYRSEEYQPYLRQRLDGARNELLLVTGEDMTGAATVT